MEPYVPVVYPARTRTDSSGQPEYRDDIVLQDMNDLIKDLCQDMSELSI